MDNERNGIRAFIQDKVENIDLSPIKERAANIKDDALEVAQQGKEIVEDRISQIKREYELRKYKPIFENEMDEGSFLLPPIINVADSDKRTDEEVCEGAYAFDDSTKEINAITVLSESADKLDVEFLPNLQEGVYYIDPMEKSRYINLNDYFDYFKTARVLELNDIARDLGATYIKISVKAEKKIFVSRDIDVKADAGYGKGKGKKGEVKGTADKANQNSELESIEVASEQRFKGHAPKQPKINFFKNEQDIKSLIESRMDSENHLKEKTITLKYNKTSGIKEADAVKIEGFLKKIKLESGMSIINEAQDEERRHFEYHIEFPDE